MKLAVLIPLMLFAVLSKAQNPYWSQQPVNTLSRTFKFKNPYYEFTRLLTFNSSDYYHYRNLPKRPQTPSDYAQYLTENPRYPYILKLAKVLDEDAEKLNYSGNQMIKYLMDFVQQAIPYAHDPYNYGFDYPRYPIETIVDGKGDCEDKAALLATLLHVFGFDVVFILQDNHAAVGIYCPSCNYGGTYNYYGKIYAYIEATTEGWDIAQIPPTQFRRAHIIQVPSSTPKYYRGQTYVDNSTNYQYNINYNSQGGDKWVNTYDNSWIQPPNNNNGTSSFTTQTQDFYEQMDNFQTILTSNIYNPVSDRTNSGVVTNSGIGMSTVVVNGITYQVQGNNTSISYINGQVFISSY